MKKMLRITACLLALLIALCGAGYAREKDTTGLLATINGKDVPIDDALTEYSYYAMMYGMYGMTNQLETLKQEIAEYYIKLELIYAKFDELGLEVSEEFVRENADAEYQSAVESYKTYVQKDGKTEEQIRKEAEDLLLQDGYDIGYFEDYARNAFRLDAVLKHFTGDISVTEEDVRAYFDDLVASDRELYESNIAYYEQASQYGERIVYTPEGFRRVKHILVLLSEEDQDKMYDLEKQLASETADKAALQAQIDEIFATIEPKAQEIMDKLTAGEDFISLMETYGEDPGMTVEPNKTEGYLVHPQSAQWVTAFRDAAVALEKPGDISQPVRTSYGLHIIRYESEVPAGPVDYEAIKDSLRAEVLDTVMNNHYNKIIDEWYAAADITVYLENFVVAE